jgi:hypothetical protein
VLRCVKCARKVLAAFEKITNIIKPTKSEPPKALTNIHLQPNAYTSMFSSELQHRMCLRNAGLHIQVHMALQPRR